MKESFVHKYKTALTILSLAIIVGAAWWYKENQDQMTAYPEGKGGMGGGYAYDMSESSKSYEEAAVMMDLDASRNAVTSDDKIIKTGSLTLHVDSVQTSVADVTTKVESWGGYVDDSSVNLYEDSYSAWMNLRIPEDKFDQAYADLKAMANYTIYEYQNTDDITLYYTDLEARLRNYQAEEAQYLELMEQTSSVDSIVAITKALSDVRYKIESVQAQLNTADNQVNYSTLSLSLQEDASPSGVAEKWRPISTIKEALKDWLGFLKDVADAVIYIAIYGWPLLILLAAYKAFRRKK